MQVIEHLQPKKKVLRAILVFLGSYLVFLLFWMQVKDYYGFAITYAVSKAVTIVKDVKFEEISKANGVIKVNFFPLGHETDMLITIPVNTSYYTLNAPLTFGIMAALYHFIRRRRTAYKEALLLLFSAHVLYVFSFEAKELTGMLIRAGLERSNIVSNFFYQFVWGFTSSMIIRFESFLIGVYIYFRFRE